MAFFPKSDPGAEGAHPAPVEIDLGMRKPLDVDPVVARLEAEGIKLYLVDQTPGIWRSEFSRRHCRVLVGPADEARVRAEFADAGLL